MKTPYVFVTKIFASIFLFFITSTTFSQSPGGVSANLSVWYKADAAATVSNNPVSAWASSGGSATTYSLTQASASNRPSLINGATNYTKYNYNPYIKFNSAASTMLRNTATTPNLLGTDGVAIILTDQNTTGITTFAYYSSTNYKYQLKGNFRFQTGALGNGYTFDYSAPTEYSSTSASMITAYGCGATMNLRKNSVSTNCNNCGLPLYNPSISSALSLGSDGTGQYSDNGIGEVILYSAKPSLAEMDKIETYLAIKYGITRGGNTQTTALYNYIASDGTTTLWDKTTNTGYNNDIACIGRDDASALQQKQSISVNNGEPVTISLGNTAIPTENATNTFTFTNNISFFAWGNNGLANTFTTGATMPAGILERLNRIWKTQGTNFNEQVNFGFENAQITGLGTIGTLCLLFDDDGNFSDATVIGACSATDPTSARVEFSGITLPVGKPYFTLARIQLPTLASNNGPICEGATLSLVGELVGGSTYTWNGPNTFTASVQNPSITPVTLAANGIYSVSINSYGCITNFTTNAIINSTVSPSAIAVAASTIICAGSLASFTATSTNGGTGPTYQWQVNGTNAGTGTVFSSSGLNNGDVVSVELTSNAACTSPLTVNSNSITITVNPTVAPTVINAASTTTLCEGTNVTFTATPTNGGTSPNYQWTVNGVNAGTGSVFSSSGLNNGDVVTVELTSNATCVSPATANSNSITMVVTNTVAPSVISAASATTICSGTAVTFTATPTNGGTSPVYQWQVNGATVGAGSTYSSTGINNNDIVTVTITSNAPCVVPAVAIANPITMSVTPAPTAAFSYSPTELTEANPDASFQNQSVNSTNWLWNFGVNGATSTLQDPNFTFPGAGTYTVTLEAFNGICSNSISYIIIVDVNATYYIPNTFTPNGDSINDYFSIIGNGISPDHFEMNIFNRWGELIYATKELYAPWNGKTSSGIEVQDGTYVYMITFKLGNSLDIIKKAGSVTVFK